MLQNRFKIYLTKRLSFRVPNRGQVMTLHHYFEIEKKFFFNCRAGNKNSY